MIAPTGRYEATFYRTDNTGKRYLDHTLPVEAFSDGADGDAMILDETSGQLRRARSYTASGGTFGGVVPAAPVVGVIPGGGWLMRWTGADDEGGTWVEPVVGWVVDSDGNADALGVDSEGVVERINHRTVTKRPAFFHPDQRVETPATEGATP